MHADSVDQGDAGEGKRIVDSGMATTSVTGSLLSNYLASTHSYTLSAEAFDAFTKSSVVASSALAKVNEMIEVEAQLEEEDIRTRVIDWLREHNYIVIAPPPEFPR
jgi:hypothetical protein